jgi:amidase
MVPLEFGSDIGGSIRVPAAMCGVYGHKPSYGIIPVRGHTPVGMEGAPIPLAVVGPLARSAADLERALAVLAGPDELEAAGWRLDLPPARHARLGDFRVLVVDDLPGVPVDSEIRGALADVATRLEGLGASVARGHQHLPAPEQSREVFSSLLMTALSRGQPNAKPIDAHAWMGRLDSQLAFRRQWAELFTRFDVVLTPVLGTVAFPHVDEPDPEKRVLTINGEPTPYFGQMVWPALALLPNLPATAAPIGLTRGGLPINIQIIGPYLEDRTTIGFAGLLEREFGGFRAPPPL